jgi:hypothetical protein
MIFRFLQESISMGDATPVRIPAVRPNAVCCAAALLLSLTAAARCAGAQDGAHEPVRVEWVPSEDGALVILNAYRMNDGALASPVAGLLIERDPPAVAAARRRHELSSSRGYAVRASREFFQMLRCTSALDRMANGGKPSRTRDEFSPEEWKTLIEKLLDPGSMETLKAVCRADVREVAPEIRERFASEIVPLFRDGANPVLPHLRASVSLAEPGAEPVILGPASIGDTVVATLRLAAVGALPLDLRLRFDPAATNAGFSAADEEPVRVVPGKPGELRIAFAPRAAGSRAGTVDLLLGGTAVGHVRLEGTGRVRPAPSGPVAWLHWLREMETPGERGAATLAALVLTLFLFLAGAAHAEFVPVQMRSSTIRLPVLRWGRRHPRSGAQDPGPHPGDVDPQLAAIQVQLKQAATAISGAMRHIDGLRIERKGAPPGSTGGRHADPAAPTGVAEDEYPELTRGLLDQPPLPTTVAVGPAGEGPSGMPVHAAPSGAGHPSQRIRELPAERERFHREDPLARQVAEMRRENEGLRTEKATLAQQKDDADREVRRLLGETDRLRDKQQRSWAQLRELAQPLGLTDDMLAGDRWAEARRELPPLQTVYTPRFVANFEQLVADLTGLYEQVGRHAASGRLAAAVNVVLNGANTDNGLRAVAEALRQDALPERLGLESVRDLGRLTPERFWRDFVDPLFRPVIDGMAKLGLYARSRSPEIDLGRRLAREGVDPVQLESALALVETRLRADFRIELRTVRLFEECFDAAAHDTARHSTLVHTLPELDSLIGRLPPRTIYDVTSVGVRTGANVTNPVVAWVSSAA